MSTLVITKAYDTDTALMESHVDNFRTGLHTLFNTDKFDSGAFSGAMTVSSDKFSSLELTSSDTSYINFGDSDDAWFGLDSSKNFVFDTAANTTEIRFYAGSTYFMEFFATKLHLPGDVVISAAGGANKTLLQSLSSYKKPVLQWASGTAISVQNNSASAQETVIYFPSFVAAVEETLNTSAKYRQADITNTANGYGASDSGAAKGGRRSGLSLSTNAWYCVYACKVRSGSNYAATSSKFVLVFDTTTPTTSNESTLDGRYGEGNWVYLGLIRYGFGATGSSSSIPKFKYSNKGWCYFYEKSTSGYGGVNLVYSTTDSDNTSSALYTLTDGMSGNVVPVTVGAVQLNITRENVSDWYIKDASGSVVWQGGWQVSESNMSHGFQLELPFFDDTTCYSFYQTRKGTGAVAKAIVLTGFCDSMFTLRRQGPR